MASIEVRDEDVKLLKLLKQDQVLKPIDPNYFKVESGAVWMLCPDCDHFDENFGHFRSLFDEVEKPYRIFPVTRAGGAIWIPKSELLEKTGLPRDKDIFFDIDIAMNHKGISTIFLSVHAPCGAAGLYNLSLFDQIELLVEAKKVVKERYSWVEGLEVKAFAPICYPGAKRRTYFVSAANWYAKQEEYRKFDYTPGRLFANAASV